MVWFDPNQCHINQTLRVQTYLKTFRSCFQSLQHDLSPLSLVVIEVINLSYTTVNIYNRVVSTVYLYYTILYYIILYCTMSSTLIGLAQGWKFLLFVFYFSLKIMNLWLSLTCLVENCLSPISLTPSGEVSCCHFT